MKLGTRKIYLIVASVLLVLLVYFGILSPYITFKNDEKDLLEAAKRYYDVNYTLLPIGSRVSAVSMQELVKRGMIQKDYYIPFTKRSCSPTESWVKVKNDKSGNPKYYPYLSCGVFASSTDHTGPKIKLKGKENITIGKDGAFTDPGILSVEDNQDGKIDIKEVKISGTVDTKQTGTYEIKYSVTDSLKNLTEVVRKVTVVEKLENTILKNTLNKGTYKNIEANNYIKFAGVLYRIIKIDEDKIKIISYEPIGQTDKFNLDKYLNDYLKTLPKKSSNVLVKGEANVGIATEDGKNNKQEKRLITIPSIKDVIATTEQTSFIAPYYQMWLSDNSSDKESYFQSVMASGKYHLDKMEKERILPVHAVLYIKKDLNIAKGNGTKENPFDVGLTPNKKAGDLLNTRMIGEYVRYSDTLWQISKIENERVTLISNFILKDNDGRIIKSEFDERQDGKLHYYEVDNKNNIGYKVNNESSRVIKSDYFDVIDKEFNIYKEKIAYKKEYKKNKYKTRLYAPSVFDYYATSFNAEVRMYWYSDSTEEENVKAISEATGIVLTKNIADSRMYGMRISGTLNKKASITIGDGTKENPFEISL